MYNWREVDDGINIAVIYGVDFFFGIFFCSYDNQPPCWRKNNGAGLLSPAPSLHEVLRVLILFLFEATAEAYRRARCHQCYQCNKQSI